MKIAFDDLSIGDKFLYEDEEIYQEFYKIGAGTAIDASFGEEYLIMDVVSKNYTLIEKVA